MQTGNAAAQSVASFLLLTIGASFLLHTTQITLKRYGIDPFFQRSQGYMQATARASTSEVVPEHIQISALDISVPITQAQIINGEWQLSDESVAALRLEQLFELQGVSPALAANESNPLILYGHNWPVLLGSLTKISSGDTVVIRQSDGSKEEYVVTEKKIVGRSQVTELLKPADAILYTCAGFLDSQRLVVRLAKGSA